MRRTGLMHFPIQPVRRTPFQKTQITFFFLSNMIMIYSWSFIYRKFKSVPYPIAAKTCVSGVKSCIRNSQIPCLSANSILKKSFVLYRNNHVAHKLNEKLLQDNKVG